MAHSHHDADSTSSLVQNGNATANQALETTRNHEEHFDTIMIQDQEAKSKRHRHSAKDKEMDRLPAFEGHRHRTLSKDSERSKAREGAPYFRKQHSHHSDQFTS
ncbi:hypothetical protein M431DRAFT_485802 [Trichoderma harzianum CBS 226.95]|uniref:Uncharacterized protein n=1 Tax=Trichoderma harzianum CBS 226.95 TaxID=983964 RepID=A0A2T4A095_TRIHA|nr:hypothetical protein M431DRAFT_485802 [Trichoderma harzianum CBS 226.95]PTB50413.1 hypothetical protein M431DRAFT_485802 [Trichoderma harzianum CBS 226.95]